MDWTAHVIWWHCYPLGFVNAEDSAVHDVRHRLGQLTNWLDYLIDLARRGVRVRVLTNSLAATDVVAVHVGYARWREKLLAAGWTPTDQWGNKAGPTVTLHQRIERLLTEKTNTGGYSDRRAESMVERLTRSTIEQAFGSTFNEVLKKAREQFTAQIDGMVQGKLADVHRSVLPR